MHDISDVVVVVIQDLFPSIHPSISHSPFPSNSALDSCRRHYTFVLAALSVRCLFCPSDRESHENRFVRKVQIRTCNARKGRREREGKGGGHLQMKTASICQNGDLNAAIKTQWPAPPPPRRRRYYTHYDGRDSEKRDAGWLDALRPGCKVLAQKPLRYLVQEIVVAVTEAITNLYVSLQPQASVLRSERCKSFSPSSYEFGGKMQFVVKFITRQRAGGHHDAGEGEIAVSSLSLFRRAGTYLRKAPGKISD